MICRIAIACALFSSIFFTAKATAEPGDRYLNMKARVLDILFPLDVAPKPYFLRMILRFGDTDTQLVVVVYPDKEKYWLRRCEITQYALPGIGKNRLSQLIPRMVAENPDVKDQEIAAKLKVDVSHSSIDPEAFNRALDDLKPVRISPVLASRIAVDESSEYGFWYDTWHECVHYTITGPFKDSPQDELVQWMIRFRASVPDLSKAGSALKP
jgi:hypothetical protein